MGIDLDNRRTAKLLLILASLLACTVGLGFYYLSIVNAGIELPDFTGMKKQDADAWFSNNSIAASQVTYTYAFDEDAEEDTVLLQSVPKGTLFSKSDQLELTLSDGPDPDLEFELTDMSGMKQDAIIAWFDERKFTNVTYSFEKSEDLDAGLFIKSEPASGKVKRSDEITVTLSTGKGDTDEETTVPDFSTYSRTNIQAWGSTNQITISFQAQSSDTIAKGAFISQSVAAGTKVKKGSKIIVVLSSGKSITVQNLVGHSKSDADYWCANNSLKAAFTYVYSADDAENIIISQNHDGTAVAEGSIITYKVSAGLVKLDDYTNSSRDAFSAYINELNSSNNGTAGISVTYKEEESDRTAGTILSQSVSGKVNPGTAVTVTVAIGRTVNVESKAGTSEDDFKAYLAANDLAIGNRIEAYNDSFAYGCIISNDTGSHPAGSRINYSVSLGSYVPNESLYAAGASYSTLYSDISSANSLGAGFSISQSAEDSSDYDSGVIIACTVSGKNISCRVSSGRVKSVTNVVNMSKDAAIEALREDGFDVKLDPIGYSDTYAKDIIFAQYPVAGTEAAIGSSVTIRYSDGPEPVAMAKLPSIVSYYSLYQDKSYSENVTAMTSLFNKAGFYNLKFVAVPSGSDSGGDNQNGIESITPSPNGAEVPAATEITIRIYQPQS